MNVKKEQSCFSKLLNMRSFCFIFFYFQLFTVFALEKDTTESWKEWLNPKTYHFLAYPNDGYLTFYIDNDAFGGTDEDYTNGIRLSWVSKDRSFDELRGVYRALDQFSDILKLRQKEKWFYNYGLSLTQLMFTPIDIEESELIVDERPYAGWLGLGFSLHSKNENHLHTMELSLGIVGPASLAEETQNWFHDFRGIEKAEGWSNQLENEPTINLHYTYNRRIVDFNLFGDQLEFDSIFRWGMDAGNLITQGRLGSFVRFGYNLPTDFSDTRLNVTSYTHQLFIEKEERENPWSLYLTLGAEGRAVLHNIFLDGNTFEDSHSVDKHFFTADLVASIGVRYKKVRLNYAHTYRTEEYKDQADGQVFGSLVFSWVF